MARSGLNSENSFVYQSVRRNFAARSGLRHSRRFQLGGGLICATLIPAFLRIVASPNLVPISLVQTSIVANAIAVFFGFWMLRSLTVHPGLQASYFILPAFSTSYVTVALAYLLLRLDYSRFLLIAGFLSCIFWYLSIFFLERRSRSMRIGVVPFGEIETLKEISSIEWVKISDSSELADLRCEAIVADFRAHLSPQWERFLADAAISGTVVYQVKQLRESLTGRVEINYLSENSFGSLIPAALYIKAKYVGDFAAALVVAVALLPLLVLVAILIPLDSPGPSIFRQRRVGHRGQPFMVYKFRTMRSSASQPSTDVRHAITTDADPRITRLGRFLRRSRIDELPQMINILRGEMSWIGPRPEAEVLSSWYESELPFYRYRHIVKPGITGWAQVNQGHVAEMQDVLWKMQYDFYYIKYFSPWLDLLILFRTVQTVITGFGSR